MTILQKKELRSKTSRFRQIGRLDFNDVESELFYNDLLCCVH